MVITHLLFGLNTQASPLVFVLAYVPDNLLVLAAIIIWVSRTCGMGGLLLLSASGRTAQLPALVFQHAQIDKDTGLAIPPHFLAVFSISIGVTMSLMLALFSERHDSRRERGTVDVQFGPSRSCVSTTPGEPSTFAFREAFRISARGRCQNREVQKKKQVSFGLAKPTRGHP